MEDNLHNLHTIDRLGVLCAQLADLEKKAAALKAHIAQTFGDGAHEGDLFRAVVSSYDRVTLPSKLAKAKLEDLGVGRAWFRRHETVTPIVSVRTYSRTGTALAA